LLPGKKADLCNTSFWIFRCGLIFSFAQRYSGGDLLGVTAQVIDMPHSCT